VATEAGDGRLTVSGDGVSDGAVHAVASAAATVRGDGVSQAAANAQGEGIAQQDNIVTGNGISQAVGFGVGVGQLVVTADGISVGSGHAVALASADVLAVATAQAAAVAIAAIQSDVLPAEPTFGSGGKNWDIGPGVPARPRFERVFAFGSIAVPNFIARPGEGITEPVVVRPAPVVAEGAIAVARFTAAPKASMRRLPLMQRTEDAGTGIIGILSAVAAGRTPTPEQRRLAEFHSRRTRTRETV
jgi:hypothetical protein